MKSTIGLAIAAALLVGTTSCASTPPTSEASAEACTPSEGKVELSYWSWMPGAKEAVDAFNSTHPDIQVKFDAVTGGTGAYEKYFNSLKAGNQPDLAMIEYDRIPNFRSSNYLQNIAACAPVSNLKEAVIPWTYNQVSAGPGTLYATPTDVGPLALYYRKDIFEKYNLAPPTTWEIYLEDAEKLKAADPSIAMTSFTPQNVRQLEGLFWQAGAKPYRYTDDAFVIDHHEEATKKVADYWQNMIDKKLVNTSLPPFSPGIYAAWSDGTIATTIGANWLAQVFEANAGEAAGKWAVMPLPEWKSGDSTGANDGGASTAVLAGTKHPYEAAVFANWLSTDPTANKILFGKGGNAASLAWEKTGAYEQKKDFFGGQSIFKTFQTAAQNTDTSFQWAPNQSNLNNYIQDGLAGAISGTSTIQKALDDAQNKAVQDLKSQAIPVESK